MDGCARMIHSCIISDVNIKPKFNQSIKENLKSPVSDLKLLYLLLYRGKSVVGQGETGKIFSRVHIQRVPDDLPVSFSMCDFFFIYIIIIINIPGNNIKIGTYSNVKIKQCTKTSQEMNSSRKLAEKRNRRN